MAQPETGVAGTLRHVPGRHADFHSEERDLRPRGGPGEAPTASASPPWSEAAGRAPGPLCKVPVARSGARGLRPPRPRRLAQQPPAPGASLPAGARAAVPRCSSVPCALCLLCVQTRCDVHTLTTATQLPAVFGPATCCVGVWPGNHSRAQACSGLCPPGVCKCPRDVRTTESQKDTFLRTCPIVK